MKIKCLNCEAVMVKVKGKYICNNYHRGLGKLRCPIRFTITDNEIDEILKLHEITREDVKEFKINKDYHYQIILYDGSIHYYDGTTIVL